MTGQGAHHSLVPSLAIILRSSLACAEISQRITLKTNYSQQGEILNHSPWQLRFIKVKKTGRVQSYCKTIILLQSKLKTFSGSCASAIALLLTHPLPVTEDEQKVRELQNIEVFLLGE